MEKFFTRIGIITYFTLCTILGFGTMAVLEGCKQGLTPTEETALIHTGTSILCVIEGEEISDPALDKLCENILPNLTASERQAVQAHLSARKARRAARTPSNDGGTDGGAL